MTKIQDWTGKDVYPGKTFDSVEDAWGFLTEDQHRRNPEASEKEFEDIMGEFHAADVKETPKAKTLVELGKIVLAACGEEACQRGYGTKDPEWVGRYALEYNDVRRDGTLN